MAYKKESGIYKITCLANGRVYVGQTTRLRERMYHQRYYLNLTKSHHTLLQKDWNLYGESNFTIEVVEYCQNLDGREQYWVKFFKSFENGYNTTTGGIVGNKQDARQLKWRSQMMMGENNPMYERSLGSGNPNSKLIEEQVIDIKKMLKNGYADKDIVLKHNLTKGQFQKIKHNRTWCHIAV